MDAMDWALLRELQDDARLSYSELSRRVHLSPPAVAERVRRLEETGHTVAPRGDTTLVSWEDADPEATGDRLRDGGIVVRNLPGRPLLRASVGAWNDETDLERLLEAVTPDTRTWRGEREAAPQTRSA